MASSKHNFTRTEITAGLLVTCAAVALAGFIAVVMGMRQPQPMHTYHASFTKIIGLNPGADVRFGGVKCGYVSIIEPDQNDQSLIKVTACVGETIPINKASIATIEQTTLTAEKHLEISTGDADTPLLENGGSMKSVTLSGGFVELPDLGGVVTRVEEVLDDVMEFMGVDLALEEEKTEGKHFARLKDITGSAQAALDEGVKVVQDVQGILEREDETISSILSKITDIEDAALEVTNDIASMVKENRPTIEQGLDDATKTIAVGREALEKVSAELETLLESLQSTLQNTSGMTETAREMIEQNRPALEQSILDVQQTIRYLKTFSRTMAEEPYAVIRGKQPVGR